VFERASDAVLALKPCFMMSPQAIAQYLAPGVFDFDLVVMDEASQIKPEDAMGAVARGRQLVVVGDPKQLGPTTFFERQAFDTDEDEPEVGPGVSTPPAGPTEVDRSESILVASAARFPTRMLRWHYRSAHPKLIAFSNTKFYDGQLIVFPTPRDRVATDGVFFTRVQDAVYSGQKNETEAAAVVEAVRRHARERPERSLLVATLNFKQADLVDELLDRAEKEDENLEAFRKRWAETLEPLDVKNLENVQGDERDAIIVSLTYGYDELNRFHRRFGPINMVGGERRLNVLFTRAKHRVDVFCSFAPQDIGAGPTSPLGVKILQDYLRYASDGDWVTGDPSAREPDSEFEVAVAATLSRLGMQVHTQVGVHGYFIDLAVVDPRAPGTYLLGIECDGATYHSGRTARDRDRLRQKTLERFGWNIHRVWSTDWFRDPTREASRVAAKVRKLMEG
jgi:superfamily I DNA and/or RNA helicase/very-short-patch-repair endonuclease